MNPSSAEHRTLTATLFRLALFAAAASLAAYIPYRYAMQSHAAGSLYGWLFPWSSLLAIAGMVFALRPRMACDCGVITRVGLGGLAIGWMAAGMLCTEPLLRAIVNHPAAGLAATFQMSAQHLFLSASVFALVAYPARVTAWLTGQARAGVNPLLAAGSVSPISAVNHRNGGA